MREQFEKSPEIKEMLLNNDELKWCYETNRYINHRVFQDAETGYINGAWYAFQEQQKKIARLQSALDDLKEWAQDEKQKSLDSDLSEYNNAKYVMAALFVENINRITGTDK